MFGYPPAPLGYRRQYRSSVTVRPPKRVDGQIPLRFNRSKVAPDVWFPVEPLYGWFVASIQPHERHHSRRLFARRIGMTERNMRRRFLDGTIDGRTADIWAVACGIHPAAIWPEWCHLASIGPVCDRCGAAYRTNKKTLFDVSACCKAAPA